MNLLHELPPGPDANSGGFDSRVIYVVVEVPKGSRNKYEYDKRQGFVKLDIGLFRMLDRGVADDRVLAVPAFDPIFQDYYDLPHIPQHFLAEMGHFFEVYKELEGVQTEVLGWERATVAHEQILYAVDLYRRKFGDMEPEAE
jgi:inorganic pyrophosphatase